VNSRERFIAALSREKVDRFFRREMGFWPSTIKRWKQEGLADNWHSANFFGFDKEVNLAFFELDSNMTTVNLGIDLGWVDSPFYPPFEEIVLKEDATTRTIQDRNGGTRLEFKNDPDKSMPLWTKRPIGNREDWETLKSRLQPDSEGRLRNLNKIAKKINEDKLRDYPLEQGIIGIFMHLRNLFGLEKLCIAMFNDPDLIDDIIENWLDLNKYVLGSVLEVIDLDVVFIAEDISYKKGLLISQKMYRRFLLPYYRELVRFLKSFGDIKTVYDSDGKVDQLIPLLVEWGCDALLPLEVQAGNDAISIWESYGEEIALLGGIDKRPLAEDFETIDKEVARVVPFFLRRYGYVPMIDHTVPPNVSLKNFIHYLEVLREYEKL